jgi:hypothetical protein
VPRWSSHRLTLACRDELNPSLLGVEDGVLDEIGCGYPEGENPSKGNGEPPARSRNPLAGGDKRQKPGRARQQGRYRASKGV